MKGHVFGDPVLRVTAKDPAGKAAGSFGSSHLMYGSIARYFRNGNYFVFEQGQEPLNWVVRGSSIFINNLVAAICFSKIEGFVSNPDEVFMLVMVIRQQGGNPDADGQVVANL